MNNDSYYLRTPEEMRAIFDRCRKKGEPAPIPLTCYIMAKSCEGLDYAHRKQVNGRDTVFVSHEEELAALKDQLAKANAELDRIKKRLANPGR